MRETEDDPDEKIQLVHGLEKLLLLKWSYHPRQSIDSIQSLSKDHESFQKMRTNNSKICKKAPKMLNS